MSRPSNNPSKNWVFTINNPTQHSVVRPDNTNPADPKTWMPVLQYLVYQLEQGEAETPHLQGYLVLKEAQRMSYVRKLSPVAHWEPRNGTHQQAKDYCTKAEGRLSEPIEMGEEPRLPGRKQSDDRFANIVKMIKEGATDSLLIDEDPKTFIQHFSGIQRVRLTVAQVTRNWRTRAIVLWGPTGTGKSRFLSDLRDRFPNEVYWKPKDEGNTNWWDGISPNHKYVVLDEFYGDKPFYFMTKLLDSNPLLVPIKSAFAEIHPCTVIITSNDDPSNWYRNLPPERKAVLFRRLTVIAHKTDINQPPTITQALDDFERPLDPSIDPIFYALHLTQPRLANGFPPPLVDNSPTYFNYFSRLPEDNLWKPTPPVVASTPTTPVVHSPLVPRTPVLLCSSPISIEETRMYFSIQILLLLMCPKHHHHHHHRESSTEQTPSIRHHHHHHEEHRSRSSDLPSPRHQLPPESPPLLESSTRSQSPRTQIPASTGTLQEDSIQIPHHPPPLAPFWTFLSLTLTMIFRSLISTK